MKNWYEDQEIRGEMVRARGTLGLFLLSHDGLWFNWETEEGDQPLYRSVV